MQIKWIWSLFFFSMDISIHWFLTKMIGQTGLLVEVTMAISHFLGSLCAFHSWKLFRQTKDAAQRGHISLAEHHPRLNAAQKCVLCCWEIEDWGLFFKTFIHPQSFMHSTEVFEKWWKQQDLSVGFNLILLNERFECVAHIRKRQ